MAFRMKGFPKHKGAKAHVGNRKGSAVFEKQYGSAFPKPGDPKERKGETTTTVGDKVYTDWETNPEGTEESRSWTQDTTYTTPHTAKGDAYYASLTDEQKAEADRKERERLERLNKQDTGVETRPIEQPVEEARGNLYGRGGTSNVRVHGSGADVGYTGSMEYDPDQDYHMNQAISSYIPEIYDESGKYKGQGKRVNFKDFEFYDDPEFQQLLTNVNFEMAVSGGGRDAMKGARDSDYGKALKAIASAEDKQAAYEQIKKDFPELVREGDSAPSVNPLQNQSTGEFVTSGQARDAASRGSGYKKRKTY
tara:strand:+ start:698 stop:1621 length:924 start_codon:yes stop_codon:yes gene_type:complete